MTRPSWWETAEGARHRASATFEELCADACLAHTDCAAVAMRPYIHNDARADCRLYMFPVENEIAVHGSWEAMYSTYTRLPAGKCRTAFSTPAVCMGKATTATPSAECVCGESCFSCNWPADADAGDAGDTVGSAGQCRKCKHSKYLLLGECVLAARCKEAGGTLSGKGSFGRRCVDAGRPSTPSCTEPGDCSDTDAARLCRSSIFAAYCPCTCPRSACTEPDECGDPARGLVDASMCSNALLAAHCPCSCKTGGAPVASAGVQSRGSTGTAIAPSVNAAAAQAVGLQRVTDNGQPGCCHSEGSAAKEYRRNVLALPACLDACRSTPSCKAIEYTSFRETCELYSMPVVAVMAHQSCECWSL